MNSTMRRIIVSLLFCGLAFAAPSSEEKEIADTLLKQLVDFTAIAIEEMDPNQPGVCYAKKPNDHNQTPCYPMAYLYKTRHPLNPYYGKKEIRDTAIAIADHIVATKTDLEWPLYNLCQTYELLRDELPETKKRE
jgi:hypothetical protein